VLLAGFLAGCTHHDDAKSGTNSPDEPQSVPLKVVVTRVAGHLGTKARTQLADEVKKTISSYVDAAFLGSDSSAAFKTFTPGAAKDAQRDQAVLTGAGLGDASSVQAKTLTAYLAVLAPKSKPAGVTARVHFVLEADGKRVDYKGRLLLTGGKDGWQVFGYDVSRSDLPAQGGTSGGDD
jgi:hypothetical protein